MIVNKFSSRLCNSVALACPQQQKRFCALQLHMLRATWTMLSTRLYSDRYQFLRHCCFCFLCLLWCFLLSFLMLCAIARDESGLQKQQKPEMEPRLLHRWQISIKVWIFSHRLSNVRESLTNARSQVSASLVVTVLSPLPILFLVGFYVQATSKVI